MVNAVEVTEPAPMTIDAGIATCPLGLLPNDTVIAVAVEPVRLMVPVMLAPPSVTLVLLTLKVKPLGAPLIVKALHAFGPFCPVLVLAPHAVTQYEPADMAETGGILLLHVVVPVAGQP